MCIHFKATRKYLGLFAILFSAIHTLAQLPADVDSLKKIITSHLADSLKLERVDHFAQQILNERPADAIYLDRKTMEFMDTLSAPLDLKKNLFAYFVMYIGDVEGKYYDDTSKMMSQYIRAEARFKDAGNVFWYGNVHCMIGWIYYLRGDYAKGYQYVNEAKSLADSSGNKRLLKKVLWSLQGFSYLENDFQKSLNYQQQILALSMELKDTMDIARSYHSLGNLNSILKNSDQAADYFAKSVQWLSFSRDSTEISGIYRDWGLNYARQGQPEKALQYLQESAAIAARQNLMWLEGVDYQSISDEYDTLKNYKKELYYSRLSTALHDTGIQKSRSNRADEAEAAQYKTKKQESEIVSLNKDNESSAKQLQSKSQLEDILIVSFFVAIIISILLFNRYRLKKIIENQHAIFTERNRIARDLHDEIGSSLGSIANFSELINMKSASASDPAQEKVLEKIQVTSRETMENMSDIVWAINPKNDVAEQMLIRMQNFAAVLLPPKNIEFEFLSDEKINDLKLNMQQRKNIFLIYKEALYNAAKYSSCKKITIKIYAERKTLFMVITDDGKGFIMNGNAYNGNGIKNMKVRAQEISAHFELNTVRDLGSEVSITVPVG